MLKKIFAVASIMCLSLLVVGCSDNKTSTTTTTEVSENTANYLEFDLYDLNTVSAVGNTGLKTGNIENFTPESDIGTMAQVGYGTSGDYIGRVDAYNSDGLVFYVFESEDDANRAFEYIKTNIVQSSAVIEDNYIIGLDRHAIDITMKHFYYKNLNLIIYHLDFMGDPGIISTESEASVAANKALHEEIMSIWNY